MAKYIGVVTGRRILLSNADNVPVELVQNDKDTTVIDFELSKIDYVTDLSQLNVAINYANIDKDTGESVTDIYTVDKTTVEGDSLKFSWVVGSNASVYAGKCIFQLVLTLVDADDVITQQWDSTKQSIEVHASLENVNITQPKSFVDLVTQVKKSVSDALASGITDDQIRQSVEQYLEKNPVQVITDNTLSVAGTPADALATGTAVDSLKGDIGNQEDKLEPIVKSKQDLKDAFYIVDVYGNIICKVDKDGVHASGFDGKNLALNDVISTYEDSFYISDSNGNVIFKADKDGVRGLNMGASSGIDSPFKGMKLLTIGDSLSAHNNWQKWLVEWLGVTFDNDENINGKDGHKPMAKGGTAIAPTTEDSIYMRSLDAKYYADDTNGTVIIIYAGQNDSVTLGTIDDTPYTDKTVTSPSNLTFYSSYMGMIENILADIPFARIYLMTQMPVRLEIGMTGTVDPYIGVIRFPDMTSVLAYEASRYKKVEAIRAISKKYSLPCIDLWADSGINDYNSRYWYGAVGGTCGQVHPNNIGYKRMAEVAVAKMY